MVRLLALLIVAPQTNADQSLAFRVRPRLSKSNMDLNSYFRKRACPSQPAPAIILAVGSGGNCGAIHHAIATPAPHVDRRYVRRGVSAVSQAFCDIYRDRGAT